MNRESIQKLIWHALPVVGLVIWGALAITNHLWYDEAYSAALVSRNVQDLISITANDVHSPFYYLLLKGFYHLCGGGTNYWSLKVFSLLFSFGYLLLGKYWIKRLFDEKTSIYFMAFTILMPILTVQATNVRMYSCGLFFLTANCLCMLELFRDEKNGNLKMWLLFAICSACSVYCHTFQMIETLILYVFFFAAILYKKQYKKLRGFFASGIFVALVYLPWLKITYDQMQLRIEQTVNDVAASAGSETRLNALITYSKEWFSAGETPIPLVMYLGMGLLIFLGYFAVDRMREQKEYAAAVGLSAVALTTIVGTYLNCYVASCFMGRYVFAGFGALALLYAQGVQQIKCKWMKAGVWIVAVFCFVMQYKSEIHLDYDSELSKFESFMEENVGEMDMVMADSPYTLMLRVYHPDQDYMIYGHLDEWMPFEVEGVFTAWEQLEEIPGTIWYIGGSPELLAERYDYEPAVNFRHMYYAFEVYRLIPKEF